MEAEGVRAEVQVSKDKAQAILEEIAEDKAIAEEKLKEAEPALLEAEAALQVPISDRSSPFVTRECLLHA